MAKVYVYGFSVLPFEGEVRLEEQSEALAEELALGVVRDNIDNLAVSIQFLEEKEEE